MDKSRGKKQKEVSDNDTSDEEKTESTPKRQKLDSDVDKPKKAHADTPRPAREGRSTIKKEIRATFVMKLFDRSIDLAKFSMIDPLYPICREWMRNAPRARKNEPEPEQHPARRSAPEIIRMIRNGIAAEVKFLPPICDLGMQKVPDELDFQMQHDKSTIGLKYDAKNPPVEKDELMQQNMQRWKTIRQHWQSHMREYDTQYAEGFEILEAIHKKIF